MVTLSVATYQKISWVTLLRNNVTTFPQQYPMNFLRTPGRYPAFSFETSRRPDARVLQGKWTLKYCFPLLGKLLVEFNCGLLEVLSWNKYPSWTEPPIYYKVVSEVIFMMQDETLQLYVRRFNELRNDMRAGQEKLKTDINSVKSDINSVKTDISAVTTGQ
jgi:hypothetical protein